MIMNNQYNYTPVPVKRNNGVAIAALVCGIISIVFSPLGLVSLAAIVLGIVGICLPGTSKGMSITGLVLGVASPIVHFVVDTILSTISFGLLSFLFFI